MEFVLHWPETPGGWMAMASALLAALVGLLFLLAPIIHRFGAGTGEFPQLSAMLAGGFCLGLGLSAILLEQPLIHLALGGAWILTAAAGLFGAIFGLRRRVRALGLALIAAGLAFLALAQLFGYVA